MKNNFIAILLTIVLLLPFLWIWKYIIPHVDLLSQGMSSRGRGYVTAIIIFLPAFVVLILIDFLKKKRG
ncbi:MAG: hypothetical protein II997_01905 [Clostridia bacterium]|nr:hypothetical protein [Clostridia bacterium]